MMSTRFQNIIKSNKLVLVDFYSDWCIPCKQIPQILKQIKEEIDENFRIVKVNVDKNPMIATKYQIRSLPTIILFQKGEIIWTSLGIPSIDEVKSVVSKLDNES